VITTRVRLDWVADEVRDAVDPAEFGDALVDHYSIPALEEFGGPLTQTASEIESGKQLLSEGEVLISKLNPRKARVLRIDTLPDRPAICSQEFIILRPSGIVPRYLEFVLRSEVTRQYLDGAVQSVTRSHQRVRPELLTKMWLDIPSEGHQVALAEYLEEETRCIDQLIIKKQRLKELLDEHWFATLRDGLSSLPSKRIKLRHIANIKRGASPRPIDDPSYFDADGAFGWVRIEDATRSNIYLRETTQYLSELGVSHSVPVGPGVVLVSISASVGQPIITAINCCYHDGWVGLLQLNAVPEFVYLCLSLPEAFGGLGQIGTQANVNSEIIGEVTIPDLPDEQQAAFASMMLERHSGIQTLTDKLSRQVTLFLERRQALIASAVSGEVDPTAFRR
jgi:type I restriction enzyme, S subunit